MVARTNARGYGAAHKRLRAKWKPLVEAGMVTCWRCEKQILPGQPWDLGHADGDPSVYRGPECRGCNRATATHAAQRRQPRFLDW